MDEEIKGSAEEFAFKNEGIVRSADIKRPSGFITLVKETVLIVIIAVLLSLIIRLFIVEATIIEQHSMEPTLHDNDKVFVSKITYHFSPIERGDIVILKAPDGSKNLVKRVIALAGETVQIIDGGIYLNGKLLSEPYVEHFDSTNYGPVTIGENEVFVLGDNRRNSMDSRSFGPISLEYIASKVFYRYWPISGVGPIV